MRNKPAYSITSVDHALQLTVLLQQEGALRVTDAADRLGVSVSTAHRLLAMLVYRDFAEQGPDRRYLPGKILRPTETSVAPVALLRRLSQPHLRRLVEQTQESANLVVLAGDEVRFIATAESEQVLRVGDRMGRSLPAHLTSGGKAILAGMPAGEVSALLAGTGADLPRLRRELRAVRRRGFAINDQLTETGLTAVGMAVQPRSGPAVAAVSIAMPTARFDRTSVPGWTAALSEAVAGIEHTLASQG